LRSWPDAVAFDPTEGAASPALEALIRGPGTALAAVLLLGDPSDPWGEASAIAIARAFVRTGRRILLIDAGAGVKIHETLGVANDEGLADHFLFGTSLELLAQPVEDGSWALVPAGPVSMAPRFPGSATEWQDLVRDASVHDTTLVVYAAHDAPGLADLAETIGAVIALASNGTELLETSIRRPYSVLVVLHPAAPGPAAVLRNDEVARGAVAGLQGAVPQPEQDDLRQELIADLRERQRAALQEPPPELPAPGDRVDSTAAIPASARALPETIPATTESFAPELIPLGPVVGSPTSEDRHGRGEGEESAVAQVRRANGRATERGRWRWLLLALLLAVSLAAGAWHYWGQWQNARRARARAAAPPLAPRATAPRPEPIAAIDTLAAALPYVVAIEAHQDLPSAERRINALRTQLSGVGFLIAPLVREGTLYYHVAAGPAPDSASASALRDTLIAHRIKTGATTNDVRSAPLAYLIAEYATRDSADARVTQLLRLDIPTYVLAQGGEPPRWRVYAGGYNGRAEADVMRQLLASAGVPDSLVTRTGRINR
jgi:hypothetical protein